MSSPIPVRMQRSRQNAKLNESPNGLDVVYVGRGKNCKWGNPWRWQDCPSDAGPKAWAIGASVDMHRDWINHDLPDPQPEKAPPTKEEIKAQLRGKNLQCWCKLCDRHRLTGKPWDVDCPDCAPCHADTLLRIANEE